MPADGQTISVACNHCGAPLEVESSTRFVTCAYCKSQLEIKRTGSSYFTSVLERIDRNTQSIAGNVETIRLQNELERVDREWALEREQYAVHDKHGNTSYPSAAGSAIGGVIAIVFGIFWTAGVGSMGSRAGFMPLFGVLFVIVGIAATVRTVGAAANYRQREAEYRARREAIRKQLDRRG